MQEINLNSINARLIISFLLAGIGAILLVVVSYFFFERNLAETGEKLDLSPYTNWSRPFEKEIVRSHQLTLEYAASKDTDIKAAYDQVWKEKIRPLQLLGDSLTEIHDLGWIMEKASKDLAKLQIAQKDIIKAIDNGSDLSYEVAVQLSDYRSSYGDSIDMEDLQSWVVRNSKVTVSESLTGKYVRDASPLLDSIKNTVYYDLPLAAANVNGTHAGIDPSQSAEAIASQIEDYWKGMGRPKYITDLIISLSLTLLILIYIGILYLLYYLLRKRVLNSIGMVRNQVNELSEGNLPETTYRTDDELNIILKELDELTENLRNVQKFALEVGNGQFDNDISVFNNQGDIGRSLAEMRDSLKRVDEEDKRRNWVNEGMAKFGDILRRNSDNIGMLCDQVIINLVKYLEANQGAIFLINDDNLDNQYMTLQSAYAYERKKFLDKRIKSGEGLIGTVWDEAESIYMVDIPQSYINIGSGLGHARPNCLLIVPLKVNEEVFGALEIASFNKLEEYQISFVESIAESIASSVSNVRTNERTRALLEESQQMTEEMKSQEEEMRQNMEELQATQEEMQRKARETEELLENATMQEEQFRTKTEDLLEQEQKLRESQYDTMAIMEGMPDLIFVCTEEGSIEDVNSATMEEYAELGEVQGENISKFLPVINIATIAKESFSIVTDLNGKTFELYVADVEKMKGTRVLFSLRHAEGKEISTVQGPDNLSALREELAQREKELQAKLQAYEAQFKGKK